MKNWTIGKRIVGISSLLIALLLVSGRSPSANAPQLATVGTDTADEHFL